MGFHARLPLELPQEAADKDGYFSVVLKSQLTVEQAIYPEPKKLFILSDIEGDFVALSRLLQKARVINSQLNWTFEDGHLVILGNLFDQGEQFVESLWFLYGLEGKAQKYGGYVHFILGDHEIVSLNGAWRELQPRYANQLKKGRNAYITLFDGNMEIWRWLKTKNIIEKIGDLLFVHGGISRELLNFDLNLKEINDAARKYYMHANRTFSDPLLQLIYNSVESPLNLRGHDSGTDEEETINAALSKYGVRSIITGHAVIEHISPLFNWKMIHVGSNRKENNFQALYVKRDKYYRLDLNGTKVLMK
ncbi:metallophosphoesterase [Chitinophaga niabensis]|uniref:Calcineurin-like phosphoesterase n=1 Tax=Chitinophaga niabensis TaxID=536979 RepID=A0A1N6JBF2_9BACT|nr:metallophosphoesterase [Chitinophaga niabensis]SIO41672.1 Calcineurin-like phosphoesterase [Chitinophaga niabensis]